MSQQDKEQAAIQWIDKQPLIRNGLAILFVQFNQAQWRNGSERDCKCSVVYFCLLEL